MCKQYLTQSAISEELNVVSQTELLHLGYRSLVNQRVLNLHGRHIKYMLNRCTEEESDSILHAGGSVTWLLEMRMPLLVISSSLCVSKLVRVSSPEEKGKNRLKSSQKRKFKIPEKQECTTRNRSTFPFLTLWTYYTYCIPFREYV